VGRPESLPEDQKTKHSDSSGLQSIVVNKKKRSKKRVLVAGGAGFIGSHLCESLFERECEVFCLDSLYTGSMQNLEFLQKNSDFHFIEHDITHSFDLDVDLIMNFACPASPIHYQIDPVFTLKTCFMGTLNLLELAKKTGSPFIQASTSEVYGDPVIHPQKEEYWGNVNFIGVRSCYDEGKRIG
jgi:UDP-glucuronate decarboxylase